MIVYLVRQVLSGISLVLVVTAGTALLIFGGGIDIARNILGETATQEQVDQRAAELGLNRPPLVQYFEWLWGAVRGDLGTSYFTSESVLQALTNRLPVTLSLVILAVLVAAVLSATLGIVAAVRRGWLDRALQVLNVVVGAIPNFWLALILVSTFSLGLGLFPATGYTPLATDPGRWLLGLVLPVTSLVVGGLGAALIVRSSVIDTLQLDFVRTLRAHGLPSREVLVRHVFRNAAPPWLTTMSLLFIGMLSGSVVIERVFAIPGLGSLANAAAQRGDVPVVLGVVAVSVVIIVIVNLVIDIANGWLNPRSRAL